MTNILCLSEDLPYLLDMCVAIKLEYAEVEVVVDWAVLFCDSQQLE